MRVRKFNEDSKLDKSIFLDQESMNKLISPILKYGYQIYYKLFTTFGSNMDLAPFGEHRKENFSHKSWMEQAHRFGLNVEKDGFSIGKDKKKLYNGIIIDINNGTFDGVVSDQPRSGRLFSSFTEEFLSLIEDIERIKYDAEMEGYTLLLFISNDVLKSNNYSSSGRQISILILDGLFK